MMPEFRGELILLMKIKTENDNLSKIIPTLGKGIGRGLLCKVAEVRPDFVLV